MDYARLITFLLGLGLAAGQQRVLDLSDARAEQAKWRIIETRVGGGRGSLPQPADQPATIRLSDVLRSDRHLYFTIEIKNDRSATLEVPVSRSSSVFDTGAEVIRFRELLINFGASRSEDSAFRTVLGIKPVVLFGNKSFASTLHVLLPGESLEIRLRTEIEANHASDVEVTQVRISGTDVALTRTAAGYRQTSAIVHALFAVSNASSVSDKKLAK